MVPHCGISHGFWDLTWVTHTYIKIFKSPFDTLKENIWATPKFFFCFVFVFHPILMLSLILICQFKILHFIYQIVEFHRNSTGYKGYTLVEATQPFDINTCLMAILVDIYGNI